MGFRYLSVCPGDPVIEVDFEDLEEGRFFFFNTPPERGDPHICQKLANSSYVMLGAKAVMKAEWNEQCVPLALEIMWRISQ